MLKIVGNVAADSLAKCVAEEAENMSEYAGYSSGHQNSCKEYVLP